MILPVTIIGHSVLRKKCADIDSSYPELKELIANMFETMYRCEGVGLAAPQINHAINLFVVDAGPMEDEDSTDEFAKNFKRVFINPVITETFGDDISYNEGCLSVPGIHEDVVRKDGIKIKYLNENFEEVEETLTGNPSRVVQHEYDHLSGTLFTDRLGVLKRKLLRGKLANISKGKFEQRYKVKLG